MTRHHVCSPKNAKENMEVPHFETETSLYCGGPSPAAVSDRVHLWFSFFTTKPEDDPRHVG